ncbi:MAG: tRNA 2-thiouridine(34) synthase MnmA, partial [Verrucomicrobiota bacterium]
MKRFLFHQRTRKIQSRPDLFPASIILPCQIRLRQPTGQAADDPGGRYTSSLDDGFAVAWAKAVIRTRFRNLIDARHAPPKHAAMKILAAMSGGVDSSVAAAVLVRAGHEVHGVYMKNWINEENIIGHCPWEEDIEDARAVAEQLGISFRVVNLMTEYREKVVKYLLEGYQSGITPNPDVMCNREMKFGVLWDWAQENGFEGIATGHYARKENG